MLWKLGYQLILIYGAHFTRVGEVQHALQANQNLINETRTILRINTVGADGTIQTLQ